MALNSSGPLSLGGATTGQSINLELGNAATATASINSTQFRTLAGVPSGAISIFNFYGKSNGAFFIAYYGASSGPAGGATTDSSGTFCATNDFENGSGINLLQISATGTFLRWVSYGGAQRGRGPFTVGTTLYYGYRNSTVTPGRNGVTSVNTSTGAVIVTGGTFKGGGTSTVTQSGNIGVDSSGNMFGGGYYNVGGVNHSVLSAYNSSGVYQGDTKPSPIGAAAYIAGVAVDSSNAVYCVELGATGGVGYIVKMTYSAGTFTKVWTKFYSGSGGYVYADTYNWITVRGAYVYVCFVPGGSPTTTKFYKLNASDGSIVWGRSMNAANNVNIGTGISVDQDDNVYVFGYARTVYPESYHRPYVVKVNSAGTTQFIRQFFSNATTANWDTGASSVDTSGNMCMSMQSYGTYFLMKLPTDGSKTGTYTVGGATLTYAATANIAVSVFNTNINTDSNGGGAYGLTNASVSASASSNGLTVSTTIVP